MPASFMMRRGTVYHPERGNIIGYNFGTSVRPDVAPIRVTHVGQETIDSFLARGGQIHTIKPHAARGVRVTGIVRVNPTRVRTSRG